MGKSDLCDNSNLRLLARAEYFYWDAAHTLSLKCIIQLEFIPIAILILFLLEGANNNDSLAIFFFLLLASILFL